MGWAGAQWLQMDGVPLLRERTQAVHLGDAEGARLQQLWRTGSVCRDLRAEGQVAGEQAEADGHLVGVVCPAPCQSSTWRLTGEVGGLNGGPDSVGRDAAQGPVERGGTGQEVASEQRG